VPAQRATSRLSDTDLVQRCRAGSPEAWNELVGRFSRYVYAICSRGFGLAPEDAEDAFQEVFTRVYSRLDTLRDDAAIRPWIAQLTRRVCLDRVTSSAHEQPVEEVADDRLERTIEELDEAFSIREELDIPSGTIASRISRCLGKLRSELEGRNPGDPPSGVQR